MENEKSVSIGEFMDDLAPPDLGANLQIPIDLFVSNKRHSLTRGGLWFADASGNLSFRVGHSQSSRRHKQAILDSSGNALITIFRNHKGSWQGFRGDDSKKDLIFRVERTLNTFSRTEFEVFLVGENCEDSNSEFKMKGSPFHRSCTIYRGDSVVAQTSLMYTLGFRKLFVSRRRFRLTLLPGFSDHALVGALIVIFFDGQKIWI